MIRHLLILVIAAVIGAVLALGVRSALHQPYADPASHDQPAPMDPKPEKTPEPAPAKPVDDPHAGHAGTAATKPVNGICAVCGMDADPEITATYRGQVIAFGCDRCPPKFAKDPERFGPYFLRNQKAP